VLTTGLTDGRASTQNDLLGESRRDLRVTRVSSASKSSNQNAPTVQTVGYSTSHQPKVANGASTDIKTIKSCLKKNRQPSSSSTSTCDSQM